MRQQRLSLLCLLFYERHIHTSFTPTKRSAGTAFPALTPPLNGRDYTYVLAGYFNDAARVHANPVEA